MTFLIKGCAHGNKEGDSRGAVAAASVVDVNGRKAVVPVDVHGQKTVVPVDVHRWKVARCVDGGGGMDVVSSTAVVNDIRQWTMPRLTVSERRSYVSFMAFDPESGRMKRKKIHLGRIKSKRELRETAARIIRRTVERLSEGWNPWIEAENPLGYSLLDDVCRRYREFLLKAFRSDDVREQTLQSYMSYLHVFESWCAAEGVRYVYQVDKPRVSAFLDYVYVVRNNTLRTRNGYLGWLKVFSKWMAQRSYITVDPTVGFSKVNKRGDKNRTVIPAEVMKRIGGFLRERSPHFLLACCLVYYCFIRPKEMALLKIGDVSLKQCTIYISGEVSKNRRGAAVTLPRHVVELMLDLKLFDSPAEWYIFSRGFKPGGVYVRERKFREFWDRVVRRELGLPAEYKFYSLKDTGITEMLRSGADVLTVRDQARHSDISITNIYAQGGGRKANAQIVGYEGEL